MISFSFIFINDKSINLAIFDNYLYRNHTHESYKETNGAIRKVYSCKFTKDSQKDSPKCSFAAKKTIFVIRMYNFRV